MEKHFEGQAASSISDDEAQTWADGLLNEERSALTVNDTWCSAARTVFGWAVKEARKLSSNPFKDAKVTQPRKVRTRETDEFKPEEAQCILQAALEFSEIPERAFDAARRWVLARTGRLRPPIPVDRDRAFRLIGCLGCALIPEHGLVR